MKSVEKANKRLGLRGIASKLFLASTAICAVMLGSVLTASADSFPPFAITESGIVTGTTTAGGVNEFLGIPYAAPPVEASRWTPPKPYGFFPGFFLKATAFGNECPQFDPVLLALSGNENCLFLNVYTPGNELIQQDGHELPVMVWIHGGALTIGSSDPYDPTRLVDKGVIVVTFNYRIGFLGFFAHPAIDAEGHLNGNYGLMDQQFALEWVKRNIEAFGGDPHRVTIFGESAGGQSVYSQLASPTAAHLFDRAISESGSYLQFQDYYDYIVPLAIGETTGTAGVPSGKAIAAALGCGSTATAACLRALPAFALVSAQPSTLYPFVDGTLLTQTPGAAFVSGQFNQVPVISGGNHDEWRLFVADDYDFLGTPLTNAEYATGVDALWGTLLGPSVLLEYPLPPSPPADAASLALGASGTDGIFACPERNGVQLLSKYVTTYAYEFNDENAPPPQSAFGGLLTFPLGAYHTAELQYLFIAADFFGLPVAPLSSVQDQLSDAMVSYWTQFAKTGNPNSSGEPVWSPYNPSTDEFQSLIPPAPVVETTFDSNHLCSAFWNTF